MSEAFSKFVKSFVEPTKRGRFLALMENPKRRDDMLWGLLHDSRNLDLSKFLVIPLQQQSAVKDSLMKHGVKGNAYIMSPYDEFDGREADLTFCLTRYLGKSTDVAIYFPVQNAGYYENHEGQVYVFSSTA